MLETMIKIIAKNYLILGVFLISFSCSFTQICNASTEVSCKSSDSSDIKKILIFKVVVAGMRIGKSSGDKITGIDPRIAKDNGSFQLSESKQKWEYKYKNGKMVFTAEEVDDPNHNMFFTVEINSIQPDQADISPSTKRFFTNSKNCQANVVLTAHQKTNARPITYTVRMTDDNQLSVDQVYWKPGKSWE